MTTYRTIADGEVDANAPVTEALMTALRDNLVAASEGAAGAPRFVGKALKPATAVDSGTTSITFSGLGDYGGAMIHAGFTASSGGDLGISFSDDGTTFYGSTVVGSVSGSQRANVTISVDFATATVRAFCMPMGASDPSDTDTTASGLTAACTHIKLTGPQRVGAMILPLGGVV